jgi:hypothetical protein
MDNAEQPGEPDERRARYAAEFAGVVAVCLAALGVLLHGFSTFVAVLLTIALWTLLFVRRLFEGRAEGARAQEFARHLARERERDEVQRRDRGPEG